MDYIGISLISRGVSMLAVFVLMVWLFNLLTAVIGMAVVTTIIGLLYDVPGTKKLAGLTVYSGKKVLSLLKRCYPLMLVLSINVLIISFARYSLERVQGTEALGIYSSVIAPAFLIQIAATVIFAPISNIFSGYLKGGHRADFVRWFFYGFGFISAITIAFAVLSHYFGAWGLDILYGEIIVPYAYLLPGAAFVAGLTGLMWYMSLVFSAVRDINGLLVGNSVGVVICLATTDFFLTRFNLAGANHVMILSSGIAVLCLLLRLFWKIHRGLDVLDND
jgi:O-antigen/teichoic acid export membrane protein